MKSVAPKNIRQIARNESGIVLVMALFSMALLSLIGVTALTVTDLEIKISANDKSAKQAFYIAEAGIEHAWAVLKTASFDDVLKGQDNNKNEVDDNGRLSFGSNVSFAQGAYDVRVTDNDDLDDDPWNDSDGTVIVTSIGMAPTGPKRSVEVLVQKMTLSPLGIQGSVTSNGVVQTGGGLIVDGRDHDIDGADIASPSNGKLGISTKSDLVQGGSSVIGGTDNGGTDHPPANPANPFAIETNATWNANTPEDVLGLKGDQLRLLAKSQINGSQYVTDPSSIVLPCRGITYVELPEGQEWQANAVDFDQCTGILIVHNTSKSAVIKNMSQGTFKGIVIADKAENIHNTIIGAVVTLSPDDVQIGNGEGTVLYSRAAISSALSVGSKELTSLAWRELF